MKNKLETCDIFIDWVLIVHGVKSVRIQELFWSAFSRIRTEYGEYLSVFSSKRENADQNNSEYGHFLRSSYPVSNSNMH